MNMMHTNTAHTNLTCTNMTHTNITHTTTLSRKEQEELQREKQDFEKTKKLYEGQQQELLMKSRLELEQLRRFQVQCHHRVVHGHGYGTVGTADAHIRFQVAGQTLRATKRRRACSVPGSGVSTKRPRRRSSRGVR